MFIMFLVFLWGLGCGDLLGEYIREDRFGLTFIEHVQILTYVFLWPVLLLGWIAIVAIQYLIALARLSKQMK